MSLKSYIKREAKASVRVLAGRMEKVELFHWSPASDEGENFGDYLSRVIVEEVARSRGLDMAVRIPRHRFWQRPRRLLAVGSILHFAKPGTVVWGSGINGKKLEEDYRVPGLDLRMVRGPLTREVLRGQGLECPEVYGEPALLLSELFPKERPPAKQEYVLVPNLNDLPRYAGREHVVSPLQPWEEILRAVLEAELVVSTSLHGLVVAESYGVPARHLLSDSEPAFKYEDYYEGSGRSGYRFARSLEEALSLGGEPLPETGAREMLGSFPEDLWGS